MQKDRRNRDPSYSERRGALRAQRHFTARIRFLSEDAPDRWDIIFLLNLSSGGALFRHNEDLKIGTQIEFVITFPGAEQPVLCEAEVLRTQQIGTAQVYEIAVGFLKLDETTKKLIAEVAKKFNAMNNQ